MQLFKRQTLCFVAAALTFGACKSSLKVADASMIIPNTAGRVIAFNPTSLHQKLDKEAIRKMSIFKMLSQNDKKQDNKMGFKSLFGNIKESGIDLQKKIYLVTEGNQMYVYFLLNDAKKFNDLFQKNVKTEKGIRYMQEGEGEEERMRLAWKGNVAILSIKQKGRLTDALLKKNPLLQTETTPLSMQELFSVKPNNAIVATLDFQKAMLETHDIAGFSPFGRSVFAKLLDKEPFSNYALNMTDEQREALEKANVITYTDFNNGEIVSKSTYNVDPSLTKDLRKLFAPRIAPEMMPLLNHKNLLGTFNLNFSFEGIAKMLGSQKDLPLDVNQRDSSLNGLSPMEMISAFDGTILAGIYKGDSAKIKIVMATKLNNPTLVRTQLQKSVGEKIKQINENAYVIAKMPKIKSKKNNPDLQEVEPAMPPVETHDDDAGGIGVDSLGNAYLLEDAKTAADTTKIAEEMVTPPSEGDTEIIPDLPSTRKKSPLGDMRMDRIVLKNNLLFLTDSSMVESLQNGSFFSLSNGIDNAQLGEGQMNMYFNFYNIINALPPSVGAMTAMIGKFPLNDLHINMNGRESFMRLKTADKNENAIITLLKTIDKVAKLGGAMKAKPQEE